MGNAQAPRVDEPRVFLHEYQDLVYQDVLASYKLFKVMQCVLEREGRVVVKLFINREGMPDLQQLRSKVLQVRDAFRSFWLHPNAVPYQFMEVPSRSAALMRPFFTRNLFERVYSRPFLSDVMKNWIAFQVICGVCQAHSVGVAHGDLKTENIFISSWNHTVLSDFALFKPLHLPYDDPSEFTFFFESNLSRRRCYLAPERFESSTGRSMYFENSFSKHLAAMDVFSLGCVLAELFLDGQTLLELPELLLFQKNQLDLKTKISCIGNEVVQDLIGSMLQRDPLDRGSATHYLRDWCSKVLPASICRCVFPLSVLLLHPAFQQPEMRVLLLRHNFANILWSVVGAERIASNMGMEGARAAEIRAAWHEHVRKHVRSMPEDEVGRANASAGLQQSVLPTLDEEACQTFSQRLFDFWDEGYRRSAACGIVETNGDHLAQDIFKSLLTSLCKPAGDAPANTPEIDVPFEAAGDSAGAARRDEDALSIVCGFICSSVDHLNNPRMKMICLDMLVEAAPFSSQAMALEQIIPYSHNLMADPVAKVSAKAINVLTRSLEFVQELPPSEASLFTEYIFPQLMYAMHGRSQFNVGEPVVLLAVAQNIAALGRHAMRLAERTVAVAHRGTTDAAIASKAPAARADGAGSKVSGVEAFDVQWFRVREAVEKTVTDLVSITQQPQREQMRENVGQQHGWHGMEEDLQNTAIGREIKVALVRDMGELASIFGRDGTHNFLLPYVITFMNDMSWEVRAAFCENAACLPPLVGQVSTEGILWPCYDQALSDPEGRVLEAALRGLRMLVERKVLQRQLLVAVVTKVSPLLMHPARATRVLVIDVIDAVSAQMNQVEQFVFLVPILRPFLRVEVLHSEDIQSKLLLPLSRPMFKKVVVLRDKELCEALSQRRPLPEVEEKQSLDLLRSYLQLLLRKDVGSNLTHGERKEEGNLFQLPAASLKSAQYAIVNPHCMANRTIQALAERNHCWSDEVGRGRPKDITSMQLLIGDVLNLSGQSRDLGMLSSTDGAPFSIYTKPAKVEHDRLGVHSFKGKGLLNSSWQPRGALLATLYEYAHEGGIPVVKVDATDDSRILVTGGRDGLVKIWNCAALEHDVAVSSSYTFRLPDEEGRRRGQRLRALCTVRNSKAFAVGSAGGQVMLYKMQPSPSSLMASEVCRLPSSGNNMSSAVMCLDHFDTDLESLLVFVKQHGEVAGWDVRSPRPSWFHKHALSGLGVPSALSLRSDGHSMVLGTHSGVLALFDLRFLAPWKTWAVSSNAPVLALHGSTSTSPGVLAALGSDTNEVAAFDVARGSCETLFLTEPVTERQKDPAVSVPVLREIKGPSTFAAGSYSSSGLDLPIPRKDGGSVRSLWSPAHSAQNFFLAAGTDRQVRYWSMDKEQPESRAYLVTPPDQPERAAARDRVKHTSNQLGDVFVVQEQSSSRATEARPNFKGFSTDEGKQWGINPNHRDAILDMCIISLQQDILVTAGRDGLVKLWK